MNNNFNLNSLKGRMAEQLIQDLFMACLKTKKEDIGTLI